MPGARFLGRTRRSALAGLLFAVLSAGSVAAGPLFRGPELFHAGKTPNSIAAGDLNGDGLSDLVVTDGYQPPGATSGVIAVLLHNKNSVTSIHPALFRRAASYPAPLAPQVVKLVDINKDGKLDAATVYGSGAAAGFAFSLGDGSGQLGLPTSYPVSGANGINFADLNGDTWLDVVLNVGTGSQIYLGTGGGAIGPPVLYPTINPIWVGDATGDGVPDILAISGSGVTLWPGNLTGSFSTPSGTYSLGFDPATERINGITVGNLNGDAAPDLVCAWTNLTNMPGASSIGVLVGSVGGGFVAAVQYAMSRETLLPRLGDIDNDGLPDVVTVQRDTGMNRVTVTKGNGDGTLGTSTPYLGPFAASDPVLEDLDQDDHLDVALTMDEDDLQGFSHNICILRGNGTGGFLQPIVSSASIASPGARVIGDFNRDGFPDLAIGDGTAVKLAGGGGNGSFLVFGPSEVGYTPRAMAAGDTDLNGTVDLIVGDVATSLLSRFSLGADGTPTGPFSIGASGIIFQRSIADMDRDGKPDLVGVNSAWQLLTFIQNGSGGFVATAAQSFPLSTVNDLVTGDWNRDGILDVAVATASGLGVSLGTGLGDLALGTWVMSGRLYTSVCTGDFNKDGIPDLAAREQATSLAIVGRGIDVFLGTGTGTFSLTQTMQTLDRVGSTIAAADVNRDGHLDLIAQGMVDPWPGSRVPGEEAEVHLGDGNGVFTSEDYFANYLLGVSSPVQGPITVGDVDRDGTPDIITTRLVSGAYRLATLRSSPPAKANGLRQAAFYPTVNGPGHVAVGDLNRDGKPDVVTGSFQTNPGVAVLLGTGTGTLGTSTTLAQSWVASQVGLADFNRDGILDIAASNAGFGAPRVSTMLGVGNGTFGARNDYYINAGNDFEVGDMNRDGRPDIVTASQDSIQILLGTGAGTFTPGAKVPATLCYDLDLADLNRDGYVDIVWAGGSIRVSYGGPGGTLGAPVTLSAPLANCQTVCVADFNRDGFPDVAANNFNVYYVLWGASVSPFSTYATSTLVFTAFDMKVGEAEANGVPYIYASRNVEQVEVVSVSPAGALVSIGSYVVSNTPEALALGDLDRDGLVDVVSIGSGGSFVAVNLHGIGTITGVTAATAPGVHTRLRQNYPNPFNPRTTIRYTLSRAEHAHLAVFDVRGRFVVTLEDGVQPAGEHAIEWDGRNRNGVAVGSGVYLYRLITESGETQSRRMVVVK